MLIKLIAVGHKMSDWVNHAYQEYAKRLPRDYRLELIEIPAKKRSKMSLVEKILQQEGEQLLAATQPGPIIALDRQGDRIHTEQLSHQLRDWHDDSQSPNLLIGGPEGLSNHCLKTAHQIWSLSDLTFPHPLVRVMIAEQIYRAWGIIAQHPYHRS